MKKRYTVLKKLFPIKEVFKTFPCELLFYFTVFLKLCYDLLVDNVEFIPHNFTDFILILSLFYVANHLTKKKKSRILYFILGGIFSVINFIPSIINNVYDYLSESYLSFSHHPILSLVLAFSLFLLTRGSYKNEDFISDFYKYSKAVLLFIIFFVFINLGTLLLLYIFENQQNNVTSVTLCFNFFVFFPLVFYTLLYQMFREELHFKTITIVGEFLIHFLLPLLTFLVFFILLAFALISLFTTNFFSYSSFVFWIPICITLFYWIKAARTFIEREHNMFDPVFKYMGWVCLPLILLYWVSINFWIAEDSVTAWNVIMIFNGAVMTLWVVADLTRKGYNYYTLFSVVAALCLVMTFIPFFNPTFITINFFIN